MNSTTIDHDCFIENNVILSSNVILGGNIHIMNGAQLGIRTIVHQNQIIGSYSMIGMNNTITKNVFPFYICINNKYTKINEGFYKKSKRKQKKDSKIY